MNRREFELSAEQTNELQGAYQQCRDGALKIRYQAVRLYGSGYAVKAVIEIAGCSRRRLLAWCRSYRDFGVADAGCARQHEIDRPPGLCQPTANESRLT